MKSSWEILQATAADGNDAHLLPSDNLEDPSHLDASVKRYLFL